MRRWIGRVPAVVVAGALITVACPWLIPAVAAPGPAKAPEYWFDAWHITQLWQNGARGDGITIAEIDTGVNASLPALSSNVLPGKNFGGRPGDDGRIDHEVNAFGHGTAMASIMVGQPSILGITGMAPGAKLLPISVPLTGTTGAHGDDHLAQAIRWAADHGGKIISMSLGGARKPSMDAEPCPIDEQEAVYHALRKGAVLLAAAGNRGRMDNAVEEPGVCLGVVSVGSVDRNNHAARFSSRHPYLTVTAPGVDIASLSRVGGSAYSGDGTSQSTAIASAAVALVWSKYPDLSGRQVVARLLATLDRHRSARDPAYGYGVVNAYRAVTADVPANAPDPVYAAADPFISRIIAFERASAVPAPKPAAVQHTSVGRFAIGNAPRLFLPHVLEGIGLAAAGVLALIALAVLGLLRRKRRLIADPVAAPARAPAQSHTDDSQLMWHNILDPNNEADPSAR